MLHALAVPSLLLVLVLAVGAIAIGALGAVCRRGMGQRPMADLSRAACPAPWPPAPLARPGVHGSRAPLSHGGGPRVVQLGADPRGAALALPRPRSCLEDRPAAGAGAQASLSAPSPAP